jgi:hypothetical protein
MHFRKVANHRDNATRNSQKLCTAVACSAAVLIVLDARYARQRLTVVSCNCMYLCDAAQATIGIDFLSKTMYLEDRTVRLQVNWLAHTNFKELDATTLVVP